MIRIRNFEKPNPQSFLDPQHYLSLIIILSIQLGYMHKGVNWKKCEQEWPLCGHRISSLRDSTGVERYFGHYFLMKKKGLKRSELAKPQYVNKHTIIPICKN